MESEDSLQDLIRCNLCDTPVPALFCEICEKYLCKDCERKHLSDRSKDHKVVSFKCRRFTPRCPKHSFICNDYCKHCGIQICGQCFFSEEHVGHKKIDLMKMYEDQRSILGNDLEELENIYPIYKEIASEILQQKTDHIENSRIVTTTIEKHKEDWHRTIDVITNELKSDFDEIDNKIQAFLNKQSNEITQKLSQITKRITSLKKILKSNDFSLISKYISNKTEFRKLPPKHTVSLPRFTSKKIDMETINKLFGSLSAITTNTKEQGYAFGFLKAFKNPFANEPVIVTDIITECLGIRNVSCLSNGQMWACSYQENVIRLYNLKSELQMTITKKSRNRPSNIAVTENEDLVYTDVSDGTINIARGNKIQPLIKIRGWKPCSICTSTNCELLAFIVSDDNKQSKVVCYSGSTEKQSIQYDDKGRPLYSTDGLGVIDIAYVSENRNSDICVSDCVARRVVVVNQAGKMRFTYTGIPCTTRETFYPYGISSDSQGHILIAEGYNNHIHILNQDGLFLRYIGNCDLKLPRELCVDTRDNLFVAEYGTDKVKKIQYCK